jgi:hypothetical protein
VLLCEVRSCTQSETLGVRPELAATQRRNPHLTAVRRKSPAEPRPSSPLRLNCSVRPSSRGVVVQFW